MWHQLEYVAQDHFLDADTFKKFVHANYRVDKNSIHSADCDKIVKDYKAFRGKEYEQERTNEVKRQVDIERRINAIKR